MAVWQAVYWLVPADAEPGSEDAWVEIEHASELLRVFDDVLPPSHSWSPDMRHWGAEECHDVQASSDGGNLAGIQVRIDLRAPDLRRVVEGLVAAATELGAVFETEDGAQIVPDPWALGESLRRTPAARFLSDPEAFFKEIRDRAG